MYFYLYFIYRVRFMVVSDALHDKLKRAERTKTTLKA